ncbi:MAG: S8 family serine peptidase [Nitrospirae bacterium]|nr:S8 family serine peptidase [Nitrospirota bacterium]
MKKVIYLLLVLFIASCGTDKSGSLSTDAPGQSSALKVSAQSILSGMEKGKYVQGEVIVKFRSGTITTQSMKTHQIVGASVMRRFSIVPNLERVKLPSGLSVRDAIVQYMSDPAVEYAEPNYLRRTSAIPNDTDFGQQWALRNTGQFANGTAGVDIKAPGAWDITTGNHAVILAVLDTGIDLNHTDLVGNRWINPGEIPNNGIDDDGNGKVDDWEGWDFTTCAQFRLEDPSDPSSPLVCVSPKTESSNPMDEYGHGTHVSGIIGAVGNNGLGTAGVMWGVQIMPLKMLNKDGQGTTADEIAAIDYAVMMRNRGINIVAMNASFGGSDFSSAEKDAISLANTAGLLLAAAAGNEQTDNDLSPVFPASFSNPKFGGLANIVSVAATDQDDTRASFSGYGLNSVQVAAPGVYVLSTWLAGGYAFASGTSMATPHVSGLMGLLYSYYTNFTYTQIRATALRYVDVLPTLSGWIQTGGRINAYRAVSSLLTPTGLGTTVDSSSQITLKWSGNATGEDGYKIERKTGTGAFAQITTVPRISRPDVIPMPPVPYTYTDSDGIIDGTLYTYKVRAFNTIPADSFYSGEAQAVTPVNPPTGLTATGVTSTQVSLSWTDNSQTEDGYKIERKGVDNGYAQIAVVGPNVTSFTDSGLVPAAKYWYRVRAFNGVAGDSLYSNEVVVMTLTSGGQPASSGGGGCSIGAKQNTPTAAADFAVLLMPLLLLAILRRRR